MSDQKNIVIVGASSVGHILATSIVKGLKAKSGYRILIIDPSKVAYWPVASLRSAVKSGWESKVHAELKREVFFPKESNHELINAKVINVGQGYVEIDDTFEGSSAIAYEYLAFATGSLQPSPMRYSPHIPIASFEEQLRHSQKSIATAKHILVVGGGATGVEMVGEILDVHPNKKITLVHSRPLLLDERFPVKTSVTLEKKMKQKGVDLMLDKRFVGKDINGQVMVSGSYPKGTVFYTKEGDEIEADYLFIAVGNSPNTQLMQNYDPSAILDSGLIKVNDYLEVVSAKLPAGHVYAVGDCCGSPSPKTLISGEADAKSAAINILAAINGGTKKPRVPGMDALVIPLGESDGAGFLAMPCFGRVSMPVWMISMAKGKSLLVDKFQGTFAPKTV